MSEEKSSEKIPPADPVPVIVTVEDYDSQFKEIEVRFRNGNTERIKVLSPNAEDAQLISREFFHKKSSVELFRVCLAGSNVDINKLTPQSAGLVELVCLALTFGMDFQMRMLRAGLKFLNEGEP